MNKTKSLSLLLVLCMILGMVPFSFAVSADETAAVYYVMYGADGDGLTRETPMGDIAEAIAAIEGNAAVDEGTVYVLNDPNGEKYHKYLTWTTPAAHTKPIHVIGLDENSKTVIMSTADTTAGDIVLAGPVHFSNVTLARMRGVDEGFMTGGYDVTLDADVLFKQAGIDYGAAIPSKVWFIPTMNRFMKFGSGRRDSTGSGGRVTLNAKSAVALTSDWKGGTYTEDVTLAVDASGNAFSMEMVRGDSDVTYEKNLNFIFGNVSGVTLTRGTNGSGANRKGISAVKGDFQTIHPIGTTVTLPDNVTVNGATYDLTVPSELIGSLDVTETGGTFRVIGDDILVATDVNNAEVRYPSNSGVLTVTEGAYTVSKFDDASKVVTLTFDTDYATVKGIKGSSVTLPAHEDKLLQKFLGWKRNGDDTIYPAGTVYNIAEDADTTLDFTSAWGDTAVVFVDAANGSDDNDGLSAETAFKTIAKGFAALETKSEGTKKLAVIGYCAYSGDLPANSTPITITGDSSGSSTFCLSGTVYANGDIVFENVAVGFTGGYYMTNGHALTVEKSVTAYNGSYMPLRFGKPNAEMMQKRVTLNSGIYDKILLGTYWNASKRRTVGGSDIVIDGASVDSIAMYADYYSNSHYGADYAGHIRFTVNSGSLGSIVFGTLDWDPAAGADFAKRNSQFADGATFQLLNNNGTETVVSYRPEKGKDVSGLPESCENVWIVTAEKADGCSLEYTENDGVYKVNGDKTAVAYQNGAAVAISSRGYITIPQGVTEVKFEDKIDYVYANDVITFYEDVTDFDVSAVEPDAKDGKIFEGWYKGETAVEKIGSYAAGDELAARYIGIDTTNDGEFYIVGAQIRKGSANVEQGLRFVVEQKGSVADKIGTFGTVVESGSLILPTDLTRGHDMKYGQPLYNEYKKALPDGAYVTTWSNGAWSSDKGPSAVPAEKIFKELSDGGVQYTVCITGIENSLYDRFYTAKGYVRYEDANGTERVLYTEYYQTSLAAIAEAAVAAGEADEAITAVTDYYENGRKTRYMAENYENRTDLATVVSSDDSTFQSWQETEGSASLDGIENTGFYELANGLTVREVEYTLWGDGRKPIEIVQVGDTHLNYVNDKDWAEQSACILATYKGRSWNRNGSSVPTVNRFMEYASFFDQTVVTGDILDYFSWGCAEMVQKLIIDKDPNVLFAIGNHETAIHMQSVDHICNTEDSLDAVHERLSTFWPNSTKYASRILKNDEGKDMVMLVVMDNEAHQYLWEEIYEGLKADVETAREKNLKILIFEHCPISTRGGEEEDYYSWFFKEGDSSGFNGTTHKIDLGKREAGSTNSELDKKVYNLIVGNADIVRGVFCGDYHNFMYTEIKGTDDNGEVKMIPQYISSANAYANGCAVKITVK